MEELNTPIFAQAKVEYTKQLIEVLYPHMFDGVKSIYDESKLIYSSKTGTPILLLFRELLEKVPIWNSEIIDSECSRIINNSQCDWIDDLITAVFISHTKILTSIGPNQSFQKINVTIPKTSKFIHKSYINTAREIWKNPYLFNENIPGHEYQRNNKEIENIIKVCIENTIRNLLPIKEILKEHLEGETETNLFNHKDELKKLLREELKGLHGHIVTPPIDEGGDNEEVDDNGDNDNGDNEGVEVDGTVSGEEPITRSINTDNLPVYTMKVTDDGIESYNDDPSDAQVEEQCNAIIVNDITIPVDMTGDSVGDMTGDLVGEEVKYDNVNLLEEETIPTGEGDRIKRLMTNMEIREEVNVIKSDELGEIRAVEAVEAVAAVEAVEAVKAPPFSFSSLYPTMGKPTLQTIDEVKTAVVPEVKTAVVPEVQTAVVPEVQTAVLDNEVVQEPKSPRRDVANVATEDIDDTSSLANFFNDMKQIVEDKGIKIESNKDNAYSLFEDASEVEKKI